MFAYRPGGLLLLLVALAVMFSLNFRTWLSVASFMHLGPGVYFQILQFPYLSHPLFFVFVLFLFNTSQFSYPFSAERFAVTCSGLWKGDDK